MGVTTTCKTIPSPTNARLVFITNKIFTLLNNCLKNATAWHTDILLSLNDILKKCLKIQRASVRVRQNIHVHSSVKTS